MSTSVYWELTYNGLVSHIGGLKTLIRLTPQKPEISTGSMDHQAHKGFRLCRTRKYIYTGLDETSFFTNCLALQFVKCQSTSSSGSIPMWTNTQCLKVFEEKMLPLVPKCLNFSRPRDRTGDLVIRKQRSYQLHWSTMPALKTENLRCS